MLCNYFDIELKMANGRALLSSHAPLRDSALSKIFELKKDSPCLLSLVFENNRLKCLIILMNFSPFTGRGLHQVAAQNSLKATIWIWF